MKKARFTALILLLAMTFCAILPAFGANAGDSSQVITGKFNYTSNELMNKQLEDTFEYRDECFTVSSFEGCKHLEVLSAQVSLASDSRYGEGEDPYEVDPSDNSRNIVKMLSDMGFSDVETNKYYTLEKQENSGAAAVGIREITVSGKKYTLLAVIPRSAGYKQEWAGNFTVGDGDIHEGFKAARDEILRFVKQYITGNDIKGALKVWITGHSRGAALSNMLGGFFAGGGIEYFGDKVSITPEDVYCYTFATPRTVKAGADRNIELSVAGKREEPEYAGDTPGEAFAYTGGGTLDPTDEVYGGVRNIISENDIFPLLPPELWGFTHYGSYISAFTGLDSGKMVEELEKISPYAYGLFVNGGDPDGFERLTLDLSSLSLIPDGREYSASDIAALITERLAGLTYNAQTNKLYVDGGYQDVLKAAAGIYGMGADLFADYDFTALLGDIIGPVAVSYLAYASERLCEEGKAENDAQAVSIVSEELIGYLTGEGIDSDTFTVDDLVILIGKYMKEKEALADRISELAAGAIPENYKELLGALVSMYAVPEETDDTDDPDTALAKQLKAFLIACYEGPAPGTMAAMMGSDAAGTRDILYLVLNIALSSLAPEINEIFVYDEESSHTKAAASISELIDIVLPIVLIEKNEDGGVVKEHENLSSLADSLDRALIEDLFGGAADLCEEIYGTDYTEAYLGHVRAVSDNITKARRMFMYMLLWSEDGFDVEYQINTLATLFGNIGIVPLAHYNELYLAYAKAADRFPEHSKNADTSPETGDRTPVVITLAVIVSLSLSAIAVKKRKKLG